MERCRLSLKTPEENKSSPSEELRSHQSLATEGPGDGRLTGTPGRCVPSCLRQAVSQRFGDSVVFHPVLMCVLLFLSTRCAATAQAKINFPAGTIKFILLYLILARQTAC